MGRRQPKFFFPVWPGMVLHTRDPSTQLGREDSELEARPGCIMKPVSNKQTNRQKHRSCRWALEVRHGRGLEDAECRKVQPRSIDIQDIVTAAGVTLQPLVWATATLHTSIPLETCPPIGYPASAWRRGQGPAFYILSAGPSPQGTVTL